MTSTGALGTAVYRTLTDLVQELIATPAPEPVAEVSLRDLEEGKQLEDVIPIWQVLTPDSKVAKKLSCGPDHVAHLISLDLGQPQD